MTTKELRIQLFQDMQNLRDGKIDIKVAKTLVKNAAQVVYSKRLDIEEATLNLKVANSKAQGISAKPTQL